MGSGYRNQAEEPGVPCKVLRGGGLGAACAHSKLGGPTTSPKTGSCYCPRCTQEAEKPACPRPRSSQATAMPVWPSEAREVASGEKLGWYLGGGGLTTES